MVRRPKWPVRHQGYPFFQLAGHAVYLCRLKCLLHGEWRQDGRQSFGHHRFSCSRGTYHDEVMTTCSCDLQGPFHIFLPFYVAEVQFESRLPLKELLPDIHCCRFQLQFPVEESGNLTDVVYPEYLQSLNYCGLPSIFRGEYEPFESLLLSHDRDG